MGVENLSSLSMRMAYEAFMLHPRRVLHDQESIYKGDNHLLVGSLGSLFIAAFACVAKHEGTGRSKIDLRLDALQREKAKAAEHAVHEYQFLRKTVWDRYRTCDCKKNLLFCGYDYGGSIATLAALDFRANRVIKPENGSYYGLVTFGAQPVFNRQGADLCAELLPLAIHYVYGYDPLFAKGRWHGYRHAGQKEVLPRTRTLGWPGMLRAPYYLLRGRKGDHAIEHYYRMFLP